eukprot:gb/GECG01014655.1/.p1 GENE.gb/GECG01014655.1/~~gb/GECG01014655.1/.p1  ORF type:complete len:887 (+),score=92.20 gb/GECG01014655.1/:1-2661(+)
MNEEDIGIPVNGGASSTSLRKGEEGPQTPQRIYTQDKGTSLDRQRQDLPIYGYRGLILETVRAHEVVVLVGETGSGKTTQVPQYLYEERLHRHGVSRQQHGKGGSTTIAVTQPRRVAAITVADRVAQEMKSTVGDKVGYSVRFDEKSGPKTRIKFCTDGMLLREAQLDPLLQKYSIIVLDEAHERTLQTDILFAVVKQVLVERRKHNNDDSTVEDVKKKHLPPLRVIVMSATLDVGKFCRYFGGTSLYIPGRQHPVSVYYASDTPSDYIDASVSSCLQLHWNYSLQAIQGIITLVDKWLHILRRAWKRVRSSPDSIEEADIYSALKQVEANTDSTRLDGKDILVFLPGQDDIENTKSALEKRFDELQASFRDYVRTQIVYSCRYILDDQEMNLQGFHFSEAVPKLPSMLQGPVNYIDSALDLPGIKVLPLYASMASEAQLSVFNKVSPQERKIILATNIAETSITIPGVACVVDPGFVKVRAFDPRSGVETLRPVPVSQAQAWQRAGRAGREGPGECYRLYTESVYLELSPQPVPEIQRVLLSEALLSLLSMGVPAPKLHRYPFLDPPSEVSLRRALSQLIDLGAVKRQDPSVDTSTDNQLFSASHTWLTKLGRKLATLPLPPILSSILVRSIDFECLIEAATVVAMLSVDAILIVPRSQERQARKQHKRFSSFEGDHWTLVNIFREFEKMWRQSSKDDDQAHTVTLAEEDDTSPAQKFKDNMKTNNSQYSLPRLSRKGANIVSEWCKTNFVHSRNMHTAAMIRTQLLDLITSSTELFGDLSVSTCYNDTDKLSKTLAAGAYLHVAKRVQQVGGQTTRPLYRTVTDNREAMIHPHSVLYTRTPHPNWIVYGEVVTTSKTYLRTVSRIEPEWLLQYASSWFKIKGGG